MAKEKVVVRYGIDVFGKDIYLGIQTATMGLDDLNALQAILMEAQAKFKAYNEDKAKTKGDI